MSANVADGKKMGKLFDQEERDCFLIDEIYGATAYSKQEEIKKRQGKTEFCIGV